MKPLATFDDVNRILTSSVEMPSEIDVVEGLIDEASDLVRAWTSREFADDIPPGITRVVARMVSRSLSAGEEPIGMTSESQSAGAFSHNRSFGAGVTDGGVWLSRQDKIKLRRWKGGAYSVKTW